MIAIAANNLENQFCKKPIHELIVLEMNDWVNGEW
jgi:hypothetical protein